MLFKNGDCTNYYLRAAAREVVRHLSPHEGLFEACNRYIRWIDPKCELQAETALEFAIWRNSLLPATENEDFVDQLCLTLRSLTARQAREKAVKLVRIANSCLERGSGGVPNLSIAWHSTPDGFRRSKHRSTNTTLH